jgi:hypothetical protein
VKKRPKGCFGWTLLTVTLAISVAAVISMCSPSNLPQKLSLDQPVYVKDGAMICNQLEFYTLENINYCGKIGGQRVVIMQTAHAGRMMKVAPHLLIPDNQEAVAGWVYYTDLHN